MSLRDKVAFALWYAEAVRAAPNVAKYRTPESFLNDTQDDDRRRWLLNADAAIAAVMEALEEPSEGMVLQGECAAWDDTNHMPAIRAMQTGYQAMLRQFKVEQGIG